MKAVFFTKYGSPDVLELREVKQPSPKDNEVLVRVYATTVSPVECAFRKGEPIITRLFTGIVRPKAIPGVALAGEIETVGQNVTSFKKGDQVVGISPDNLATHAEYKCLHEDGVVAIKPANMTYEEAAGACDGALTALPFLRDKAKIQGGHKVLINGASGSIGTVAVQLAKYFGAEVTGVCSTTNVHMVKSLGADDVIDYTKEDFTKTGQTYDVIFDAVGKSSFSHCKGSLKPTGVYLTTVSTPAILLQMFWTSRIGSKKAIIAFTGLRSETDKTSDLIFVNTLADAGRIKSVIDRRYPMEQIAEAHSYVERGHKKGNVVLTFVTQ